MCAVCARDDRAGRARCVCAATFDVMRFATAPAAAARADGGEEPSLGLGLDGEAGIGSIFPGPDPCGAYVWGVGVRRRVCVGAVGVHTFLSGRDGGGGAVALVACLLMKDIIILVLFHQRPHHIAKLAQVNLTVAVRVIL